MDGKVLLDAMVLYETVLAFGLLQLQNTLR